MPANIGKYERETILGSGGQGTVYLARDTALGRMVALKVVREDMAHDPRSQSSLLEEARAAARLNHPNIVTIYEVASDGEQLYVAMELAPSSLHHKMEAEGALHYSQVIAIASDICQALQHCHDNHIIHKDIKPQNILLTKEGQPKLTDFGLARPPQTTAMRTSIGGTAYYSSPEQIAARSVEASSDIYSLGVVIYHMLTGQQPFTGDSEWEILNGHMNDPVPTIDPSLGVPRRLEEVVRRSMEKRPADRFTNARDMALNLQMILQNPPNSGRSSGNQSSTTPKAPLTGLIDTSTEDTFSPREIRSESPQYPRKDSYSRPRSAYSPLSRIGRMTSKAVGVVLIIWGLLLLFVALGVISGGENWQGILVLIGGASSVFSGVLSYTRSKLGTSSPIARLLAPLCTVKNVLLFSIFGVVIFIVGIANTAT